jgi:hypothetical protein
LGIGITEQYFMTKQGMSSSPKESEGFGFLKALKSSESGTWARDKDLKAEENSNKLRVY